MFLLTELSDACAAVLGVSLEELWASWREYCHLSLRHRQTRVAVEARLQQQPAGPSAEEAAMWTGATKDNQNVMVCPALLRYVSKEAETQVNLLKSVRKAREERALAGRDA